MEEIVRFFKMKFNRNFDDNVQFYCFYSRPIAESGSEIAVWEGMIGELKIYFKSGFARIANSIDSLRNDVKQIKKDWFYLVFFYFTLKQL